MNVKLIGAILVTWSVSGQMAVPCQQGQKPDVYSSLCFQAIGITRSEHFDTDAAAAGWVASLKELVKKGDLPYKISEIHVYSEEGAK